VQRKGRAHCGRIGTGGLMETISVIIVGMLILLLFVLAALRNLIRKTIDDQPLGSGRPYSPPVIHGGECPDGCSGVAARAREQAQAGIPYGESFEAQLELAQRLWVLKEADMPTALPAGEEQISILNQSDKEAEDVRRI